ncbi:MAG: hypothetical protein ABIO29_08690 [Sphingomicrobium sp.]
MKRLPMTNAAAAMFRALAARAGLIPDRTLLSAVSTTDWHSLTLEGERHRFALRLTGPTAQGAATALCDGIEDAEFVLSGWIVADIAVERGPLVGDDGAVEIGIEALTIRE